MSKVAVLIDGSFFLKRYRSLYKEEQDNIPKKVVRNLYAGVLRGIRKASRKPYQKELYRIFFYDCPPLEKNLQNPVTKKGIRLKNSPEALFRNAFHDELRCSRKVALRLGRLGDNAHWQLKPDITKQLLNGKIIVEEIQENDVVYNVKQTGVDMRIGLDIASLSYKKAVDQIILIAGDSDFVPAAKMARREGIDFVLDPMRNHINHDLHEHIDGLLSNIWPKP